MSTSADGGAGSGQPSRPPDRRFSAPSGFDARSTEMIKTRPEPTTVVSVPGSSAGQRQPPPPLPAPQHPASPKPARLRRNGWIIAGGAAAVVVLLVAGAVVGYLVGLDRSAPQAGQSPSGAASPSFPTSASSIVPGQVVLPFTGLNHPSAVAVDTAGNVYVIDSATRDTMSPRNRVLKLAAGSTSQIALPFTGLNWGKGVAVDSAGAVYVADAGTDASPGRVLKLAAGSDNPTELPFIGLDLPADVEVDAAGAVYVVDRTPGRVLKLAAGSDNPTELPFSGLLDPTHVAVDTAGTVYIVDHTPAQLDDPYQPRPDRVLKLAVGSTTQITLPFTDLATPGDGAVDVAVDGAGAVYVAVGYATFNNRAGVLKLAAGSTTPIELPFNGLRGATGVVVDTAGNVYFVDASNKRVVKLPQ